MKKSEIINVFVNKSKWTSILILIVICAVIFSTTIIKNIALGTEKKIYDRFISFFPHIQIFSGSQQLSQDIFQIIKKTKAKSIVVKRLIADIDDGFDNRLDHRYVYVTEDVDQSYFESLIPNLCKDLDSPDIPEKEKDNILHSLKTDTVQVDAFQKVYLPGIIIGKSIAKKLKISSLTTEFGTSVIKLIFQDKEQEFVIKGFIDTGNPLLTNICLIDDLYDLSNGFNADVKYEIFLQQNRFEKASKIDNFYDKKLKGKIEKIISPKKVTLLTDHKELKELIDLSKRISKGLTFISTTNLLLAIIALFALISLIIQNRRKEISIMLSLGKTHRYIFSIFGGIILFIFILGLIIATILIFLFNSYWHLLFVDIPYQFVPNNFLSNILISILVSFFATIVSYYLISIKNKKLIVEIFRGK